LEEEGVKGGFKHHFLFPTTAIIDPLMASTMPPKLTASTGIDALTHAIEASLSIRAFPLTLALGYTAIELVSKSLMKATYSGNDLEARYDMSAAAFLACSAETNAGPVEGHAFGLVVGAFYHLPHGAACGLALPYVMEYNAPVCVDTLVRIGMAMGENNTGLSKREAAYKAIYAARRLIEDLGLPTALREIGNKEDLPKLVKLFVESPWITGIFNNCKRKMTKESAQKLFENIFEGKLGRP
jgi:alcohol dehydrogenase class IV